MARHKRSQLQIAADDESHRVALALGASVRAARKRRRLTQAGLAARVGTSATMIGRIERGEATAVSLRVWVAVALALGLTPRFALSRDPLEEPLDAGHLAIQELLLRLGRAGGYTGVFELPVRPTDPRHSIDVCLRDPRRRRLLLLEAWNLIGDIGAGARSFDRKLASAREVGAGLDGRESVVTGAWVVRATGRNRELIARYPAVFAARFPGSSRAWVNALTHGAEPPAESGLVWCDVAATRVFAWRRPWM